MSGKRHESLIKTPKQLVIVLVLSFAVPVIVIILLANLATSGRIYDEETKSPEAVAKRIKPVAEVNMATAGTEFKEPAAGAPQAQAVAGKADGKQVYESTCMACHGAGVANAPKFGDKKAWAMHLMHGTEHVYENALKGKGAMPPKGGNLTLSDAEVKAAVDYMLGAVK
ncbi:MAG: cytochrome c5 family protein [Betaproteobacteria bacterium]|nr:MAG: cytochrome c5 family protein [Betaproteobacteria bacterium]TMH47615.1 MAG: cytochrome c5 family protein [Betaproteobacteria bacterium]